MAVRTFLELTSPAVFRPAANTHADARIEEVHGCPSSFFRFLYREVGRAHHWIDRLSWTDQEVLERIGSPRFKLFVMYVKGAPAGYFELWRHDDGSMEVAYFGLLPEFIGRGLGKSLLTVAVEHAWAARPTRVWLHTCSLDHAAALPNYLARGFVPFKEEHYEVPEAPPP
jgi:GNAT superfamily N-acetyltransferase